ncbi:MAG TPA: ASKHA domain-containing protein [Syntrophorhabdaceae bacterium]|nr:ASKHA domain-containing protein [Syntrophorhabdaceae bacterium]
MDKHRIKFLPLDYTYPGEHGENLLEIAMKAGVYINASCGGNGTCGKCKVRLIDGQVDSIRHPKIDESEYNEGVMLACQTNIKGDAVFEIPLESRVDRSILNRKKSHGALSAADVAQSLNSVVPELRLLKLYIEMSPPGLNDQMADAERLIRRLKEILRDKETKEINIELNIIKKLPHILRDSDWKTTIVASETDAVWNIIDIHRGDTTSTYYGVAVDVGTTTVCCKLIDLRSDRGIENRVIGESADYNAQISYGDDVITRIMYAGKKGGLKRLQEAIAGTIDRLIEDLIEKTGVDRTSISHLVAAGNTTMTHLLLGVEPRYIMISPYTPAFFNPPFATTKDVGIKAVDDVPLYLFPCVSSYVGGDIVAGVLSAGMADKEEISLFIDIGTNGEIVLGNRDWLMCASCSAGPAFEGGGIKDGMRATYGAIEQVRINQNTYEPMILTIGHERPSGICGSGLIDCLAEMILAGIITQNGRFNRDLPTRRIREVDNVCEYVLCYKEETRIGRDITITEMDIDNLIRAKAAMFAGCKVLLDSVGLSFFDLHNIIIAGGFGHYIDPIKAQIIGLLPELPSERFKFIGNSSLHGACLYMLSKRYVSQAVRIAGMMTNIELANNNRFMDEFVAAMFLPHTDERLFPETMKNHWQKNNFNNED